MIDILINKIKDPFYTTKKNGTGLGVPFSIEIITAHDGEIDFLAREKGTNVKITLPLELWIDIFWKIMFVIIFYCISIN